MKKTLFLGIVILALLSSGFAAAAGKPDAIQAKRERTLGVGEVGTAEESRSMYFEIRITSVKAGESLPEYPYITLDVYATDLSRNHEVFECRPFEKFSTYDEAGRPETWLRNKCGFFGGPDIMLASAKSEKGPGGKWTVKFKPIDAGISLFRALARMKAHGTVSSVAPLEIVNKGTFLILHNTGGFFLEEGGLRTGCILEKHIYVDAKNFVGDLWRCGSEEKPKLKFFSKRETLVPLSFNVHFDEKYYLAPAPARPPVTVIPAAPIRSSPTTPSTVLPPATTPSPSRTTSVTPAHPTKLHGKAERLKVGNSVLYFLKPYTTPSGADFLLTEIAEKIRVLHSLNKYQLSKYVRIKLGDDCVTLLNTNQDKERIFIKFEPASSCGPKAASSAPASSSLVKAAFYQQTNVEQSDLEGMKNAGFNAVIYPIVLQADPAYTDNAGGRKHTDLPTLATGISRISSAGLNSILWINLVESNYELTNYFNEHSTRQKLKLFPPSRPSSDYRLKACIKYPAERQAVLDFYSNKLAGLKDELSKSESGKAALKSISGVFLDYEMQLNPACFTDRKELADASESFIKDLAGVVARSFPEEDVKVFISARSMGAGCKSVMQGIDYQKLAREGIIPYPDALLANDFRTFKSESQSCFESKGIEYHAMLPSYSLKNKDGSERTAGFQSLSALCTAFASISNSREHLGGVGVFEWRSIRSKVKGDLFACS